MIERQNVASEPIRVGDFTLTTHAQIVRGHFPFGGFAWARPIAVVVARAGQRERVPIVDVTRRAQLTMLGLTLMFILIARQLARGRKKDERHFR